MRFIACILGFGVALGAVFSISSYTDMLDRTVNRVYFIDDNSLMVIEKGSTIIELLPYNSLVPEVISELLHTYTGVIKTIPLIFKNFENVTNADILKDIIVGIDLDSLKSFYLKDIPLDDGKWPEFGKNEAIIGPKVAEGHYRLNDTIIIRNQSLIITGIMSPDNPIFDRFVYCDYSMIQDIFEIQGFCSAMYILGDEQLFSDQDYLDAIEKDFEKQYSTVNLIDSEELDEAAGNYYSILDIANVILGAFPVVIGTFFVFVLLMLNIKDQEREFGMLRAIGMSNSRITGLILIQSLIITIFGYLLSIILGFLFFSYAYFIINSNIDSFGNIWNYSVSMSERIPIKAYWETLIISIIVGLLVAIYPTYKTAKKSIVATFRKEE